MRPYNTYRNPELSEPVSSVENTLTDKMSNSYASFDILRSLSESISVDCGSFEISAPTEFYKTSSVPAQNELIADRTERPVSAPVQKVPVEPIKRETTRVTPVAVKSSEKAVADMDDDNYDCMNDPNYRPQSNQETNSPSFEELMARTAEGIAKMREEIRAVYPTSEIDDIREKINVAENSNTSRPQTRTESCENVSEPVSKPSTDSRSESSMKKGFLSSISWDKTRKLLFSRETIKLTFLSIAVSALIVSAVIYRSSSRQNNNGLPESDDVVMNQSASEIQNNPVQGENELTPSSNDDYSWRPQVSDNWASSDDANPRAFTDQMRGDYHSPTFDATPSGFEYGQNESDGYFNPEDAGRPLASPHNSNNENNQIVNTLPPYNAEPEYAEVAPAIGAQYNANDYESPVLEDDSVSEYSETGYNSNFMR